MMEESEHQIMIEADQITKVYGSHIAVKDISFTCQKGEVVGFLGPNGAGKTTTMRILTGYMPPTSGTAYIAGHNTLTESIAARQRLGYLPETVPLYPEMTVEGYLAFVGRVRRISDLWEKVDNVLEAVDLLDRAESYIGTLSKGMRQRVGLAQALLHDPDVLVLDEPTIGLDPRQVVELREMIKDLGKRHTILLSTHILSEVEQVCDRVIMVIDGRIWADMPLAEIVGEKGERKLSIQLSNPAPDTVEQLARLEDISEIREIGRVRGAATGNFTLSYSGRDETRIAVAEMAVQAGWGLLGMSVDQISLEMVFLDKLRVAEASRTEIVADVSSEISDDHSLDDTANDSSVVELAPAGYASAVDIEAQAGETSRSDEGA